MIEKKEISVIINNKYQQLQNYITCIFNNVFLYFLY